MSADGLSQFLQNPSLTSTPPNTIAPFALSSYLEMIVQMSYTDLPKEPGMDLKFQVLGGNIA